MPRLTLPSPHHRRLTVRTAHLAAHASRERLAAAGTHRRERPRPTLRIELLTMLRPPLARPLELAPLTPRMQPGQHPRVPPERIRRQPRAAAGTTFPISGRVQRSPPIQPRRDLRRHVHAQFFSADRQRGEGACSSCPYPPPVWGPVAMRAPAAHRWPNGPGGRRKLPACSGGRIASPI